MNANGWQIFVEVPGKAPIELETGEAVIGRSRACAVQIAETTVSRQHAVFVVELGSVRLRDLGSSNGTYVNGKRVDGSQALSDGDRVVVGEAELIVRILAPLGPAEPTQRLVIPPLAAPATPAAFAAEAKPAEPAPSFRRTPAPVEAPPPSPAPMAPLATLPPMLPMPPLASFGGPPPLPAERSPAPALGAGANPEKVAEPARKGELLPSIQEIELAPMPPPLARRAPAASATTPAGFWIRVAASLLDMIPLLLLALVGLALAFFVSPQWALLLTVLEVGYVVYLAVVMPALKGTTPGKKFLKLAIVSEATGPGQGLGWSTALLRLVGHLVCSLTFSLGYLLVAFTEQKQGLHDLIAKTRVVRRR